MAKLTLLKSFTRRDDRARVFLYLRDDGFYEFTGDERVLETMDDGTTYEYWEPRHESGIYQSLEAAERDAHRAFPWLADAVPGHKDDDE